MREDLAILPDVSDIKNMDDSKHAEDARRLLSELVAIKLLPSRKEFCHVRDYILTYITLENASKPGCISNMTLAEYSRTEYQNDNSCIITNKSQCWSRNIVYKFPVGSQYHQVFENS